MKHYREIAGNVLARRDKYRQTQKTVRISSAAAVFVAAAVFGIVLIQSGPAAQGQSGQSEFYGNAVNESIIVSGSSEYAAESTMQTSTHEQTPPDGGDELVFVTTQTSGAYHGTSPTGGDYSNWFNIPALPFEEGFELTGEELTDTEAQAYFEENSESIINSLAASGVSADAIKIAEKGYCHVNYNGTEGKRLEIKQNFRDYLVYSNDELISIITLYKESGAIYCTPSFGAPWFADFNAYLQQHKGEELIFVYAGFMEIVIAPDNTFRNPMGYEIAPYFEGIEKPYEVLYHEKAVYVP